MEYFREFVATPPTASEPYHRASEQLNPGDILYSATRAFRLVFQTDGNLVLYAIDDSTLPLDITKGQYTKAIWSTGTNGSGAVRCNMQTDGNLVLYAADGTAVWNSGTNGNPGAFLMCQDDGNLVIYVGTAAPWASGTYAQSHGDSMGNVISLPSLQSGFSFQLNAYSPKSETVVWQQYTMSLFDNQIVGGVDNWPPQGPNLINYFFNMTTMSSAKLPAKYKLTIQLQNDGNGTITGATYTVIDNHGNTQANVNVTLESISNVTPADLAPIVAFQLNLVGPVNGEIAELSSGAGRIIYTSSSDLTPLTSEPSCALAGSTQETANSFYGTLSSSPSKTFTQSFRTSSVEPMIRSHGKLRPETKRRITP